MKNIKREYKNINMKKFVNIYNNKISEFQTINGEKYEHENSHNYYNQRKKKLKDICIFITLILLLHSISVIIILLKLYINEKKKNVGNERILKNNELKLPMETYNINIINKPLLPIEKKDYLAKNFTKINYNSSNIRYHYHDLYYNRKIFKINYSYLPYLKINKSISYDENANNIYKSTGMINVTKLNYYYYNKDIDTSSLNHIHLSMGFDSNYILLSSISIASILNTSSINTYIHFHIALNGCKYNDIKPIIDLRRINENSEFVFYNAKQAEYDFGERGKRERRRRGIGDYTRILIPEIVNNTNRIIIMDSGDILAQKDLSELYFFNIEDNYFVFSLEDIAGKYDKFYIFGRNNFYPNSGICLVNVRKFRIDNLYRNAFFAAIAYYKLPCPYQDIFLMISNYKFKYWPLNYNCPQFFENNEQIKKKEYNTKYIKLWLEKQKNSPFKYSKEELLEAALNPIIIHLYSVKPFKNLANRRNTLMWINYAKMTGLYEQIKKKYPKPFKKYENKK